MAYRCSVRKERLESRPFLQSHRDCFLKYSSSGLCAELFAQISATVARHWPRFQASPHGHSISIFFAATLPHGATICICINIAICPIVPIFGDPSPFCAAFQQTLGLHFSPLSIISLCSSRGQDDDDPSNKPLDQI